jgi:outer membrane protein assembly factor BamA
MFELDESSPPSIVGGGGMYSENGSFGGAVGFKAYFDEDRYRLSGGLVTTRLVFDYATPSGDVPLRENVVGLALELLVRAWERVYVGPVVLLAGVDTDLVRSQDQGKIPDDQLEADNLWFGIRAQRDTRDSVYYPRSGSLADLQVRTSAGGSDFDFTVVPIAYNHFFELGDRDVLAVRGAARSAFGDVPFYGESYFGADSDLRGYAVGTYHDDALLAGQAEYRRELFWRLGGVAFAGVGTVAPSLGELDQGELLPSAGLGLRITLDEKSHLNYRIDYAWGRDQSALYLSVGEAF